MQSRRSLRSNMRIQRRDLSKSARTAMSEALARHVRKSLRIRRARRIACYLSNDGEVDLGPALDVMRANGTQVLLPALHGGALWFLPYGGDTALVPNRFGIPEPAVPARTRCRARDLDLVLMPLVAFDATGNRLGMGGGFYDRTFSYLRNRVVWHKPLLIGVAYEFQRLESLPARPWDVPLHGVVTERGFCRFVR
jgi:5-formyltetrahydrofolate cyclo-ligase